MSADVTLDDMREALERAFSVVFDGTPIGPCSWGCPDGAHYQRKVIPEQTTRFVIYGFFAHNGRCLYVGQTRDLIGRCYQHTYRTAYFHTKDVRILAGASTRAESLRRETDRIKALDPLFNVLHSPSNHGMTEAEVLQRFLGELAEQAA